MGVLSLLVMVSPESESIPITDAPRERRECVFLVFAGLFLGAMPMLNIIGITRFIRMAR